MTADKISIGPITIYGLRDGFFSLDGGAMFGVVPKVLWEKIYPADEQNRIKLGLNSLLIQKEGVKVLVDTGMGGHLKRKLYEYYAVDQDPGLILSLQEKGVTPGDIDFVINTHLHFDHCGGNTFEDESGHIVASFPNARYIVQKGEWEYANDPCERDRSSYAKNTFLPIKDSGLLELVEGNTEISEGIEVILTPGHTAYHQCVKIQAEGKVLFFLGDMVPTSGHVGLSYIMSYDLMPLESLESKKKILNKAIDEDWIVAFNHDPDRFFGKIRKIDGKYTFQSLS
jgi:glyoxylase-like metal-dependent hydrolase (beta-lactamase superfamily II)